MLICCKEDIRGNGLVRGEGECSRPVRARIAGDADVAIGADVEFLATLLSLCNAMKDVRIAEGLDLRQLRSLVFNLESCSGMGGHSRVHCAQHYYSLPEGLDNGPRSCPDEVSQGYVLTIEDPCLDYVDIL